MFASLVTVPHDLIEVDLMAGDIWVAARFRV